MKIFISAYACEPYKGSEPGIGWNFVNQLSKCHEVHVLTRANNREAIEAETSLKDNPNLRFHYYDVPKALSFWKKKKRGYQLYYYLWQLLAYFKYKDFINNSGFDIVQHLTFGADWMPSLFMRCKPYTIWGPVGSEDIPNFVYETLPTKLKIKESLRAAIKWFFYHIEPLRKTSLKHADLILSHSSDFTNYKYPEKYSHKIKKHIQTGLNTSEPEYQVIDGYKSNNSGITRLIIASELVDWKGVTISAEVFSRIAEKRDGVELVVLGEGPEKKAMTSIFNKYGVQSKVNFKGFVDKQTLVQELYAADILLYPAYHHGLATIILQSMYSYLPIISMDGDIISNVVHEKCGLSASGTSMLQIKNALIENTLRLIDDRDLRTKLTLEGRQMVETTYEWEQLILQMQSVYECVE